MPRILRAMVLFAVVALVNLSLQLSAQAGDGKQLQVTDIMKFREAEGFQLSANGGWIAYAAVPDMGAITGYVQSTDGKTTYSVAEGTKPQFSRDGNWVIFTIAPSMLEKEKTPKAKQKNLKTGLVLLNTATGKQVHFTDISKAAFSGDSGYLGIQFKAAKDDKKDAAEDEEEELEEQATAKEHYLSKAKIGTSFKLIKLADMSETTLNDVQKFAFSERGSGFAYSQIHEGGTGNQLVMMDLQAAKSTPLDAADLASYPQLAWHRDGGQFAYLKGSYEERSALRQNSLHVANLGKAKQKAIGAVHQGWIIPDYSKLTWSRDGARLFFGEKPVSEVMDEPDSKMKAYEDLFDVEKWRAKKELKVWHGDDPYIKPMEIKQYKRGQQETYTSLYDVKRGKALALADEGMESVRIEENANALIGYNHTPYKKEVTWDGRYQDAYWVDLKTGKRQMIEKHAERAWRNRGEQVSPSGRYVAYYKDQAYHLYDTKTDKTHNLTASLSVPMGDELHDYPSDVPGYGMAGWLEKDAGILIYDRYDIWLITPKGKATNLTKGDGRNRQVTYRMVKADEDQDFWRVGQRVLLTAYYDQTKEHGFYQMTVGQVGVTPRFEGKKTYRFIKKAKEADVMIYTREDLHEFPDYWIMAAGLEEGFKISNINPQSADFKWGEPMLVNWTSTQGKPLQGVLIKPADYQEGQQYPVLVYYYRYSSQRMYNWNQMKVNHRPNFPYYTSNGYAVFLPDIKFEIGYPGASATAALVPGVQKIIDLGIADPKAIGLHGHSWSGYQTAHVVTQTDVFAAAVAGAPVSNMTSAYSGIRLGSGMARQFQYEKTQSRIGATLYDKPHLYIENSPLFFAERIKTPLLLMHGNVDDAVPWQQSIEMYLAMRRLGKEVVFLEYEGEPHHLKKYANKVDYTLKMKAYFDHYLKGLPAESWITKGEPYMKPDTEKPVKN